MNLSLKHIRISRGNKLIFGDLNFQSSSKLIHLTGQNGVGKSSLLLALSGLIPFQSGTVSINNNVVSCKDLVASVGLSSIEVTTPPAVLAKHVTRYLAKRYLNSQYQVDDLIAGFNFASQLNNTVGELSEGSLRKLSLITALMKAQALLLLDEPVNGLDAKSNHFLINDILTNMNVCTLLTGHVESAYTQLPDLEIISLDSPAVEKNNHL